MDVSPHRWNTGQLGYAHACHKSQATTCVFIELVRGFWGAALGGGPGFSQVWCGQAVVVTPQGPGTSTDLLRTLCLKVLLTPSRSLLMCVGVCTHRNMCLWAYESLHMSAHLSPGLVCICICLPPCQCSCIQACVHVLLRVICVFIPSCLYICLCSGSAILSCVCISVCLCRLEMGAPWLSVMIP